MATEHILAMSWDDRDDLSDTEREVLAMLEKGRCTPAYIADETNRSQEYVRERLRELKRLDLVDDVYRGLYELTATAVDVEREPMDERRTEPEPPTTEQEPAAPSDGDELPDEIEPRVWSVVDRVAQSWDDDERLENRRQAAAHVLQYAVETGEPVGRSHDVVERVREAYPVGGQNEETYWRQNIRDVLSEVGEYSRGKHAYTVAISTTSSRSPKRRSE